LCLSLQVEANYKAENPYHNNVHAADVTQTAAVLLRSLAAWLDRMGAALTPLQQFAILLSSAVHDLAHPGVNNDFHVKVGLLAGLGWNGVAGGLLHDRRACAVWVDTVHVSPRSGKG
jgi:hypothetical protein